MVTKRIEFIQKIFEHPIQINEMFSVWIVHSIQFNSIEPKQVFWRCWWRLCVKNIYIQKPFKEIEFNALGLN